MPEVYRISSSLQKPPVAGLVTMGRLQLSKGEDRDRDPEGPGPATGWYTG